MRVLLVGNTGYITERFMGRGISGVSGADPRGCTGADGTGKKGIVHRPFPEEEAELGDLFLTYEFEEVVYFSNYLTFHGSTEGEAEKLRRVLQYCKGGPGGPDSLSDRTGGYV